MSLNIPSKTSVLENLKTAHIMIFVYYKIVDSIDPSNSDILLREDSNRIPEKLIFRNLARISFKYIRLAYLFACFIAEFSNIRLRDKVLYITFDFQIAGFPYIIRTLWPIDNYTANAALKVLFENYFRQYNGESVKTIFQAVVNEMRIKSNRRGIRTNIISWASFVSFGCSN